MSLQNPVIEAELERLLLVSGLNDHAWLSALEEYDQPPLFTRYSETEFMRAVEVDLRGPSAVSVAERTGGVRWVSKKQSRLP
ncbi:MAG: hypothetical protein R3B07_24015 [Polyangiaceae bacterium]